MRTKSWLRKTVVPAAWMLWFALLVATPYYAFKPYQGSLFSGSYAYIALGSIVGAWASVKLSAQWTDRSVRAVTGTLAALGVAISLVFLCGEWAGLPLFIEGRLEESIAPCFRWLVQFEQPCLSAAAFSCVFVGVQMANGGTEGRCTKSASLQATLARGTSSKRLRMGVVVCPFVLFVLGFVRVVMWSPFLPFVESTVPVLQVSLGAPAGFVFLPLLVTFLLGLASMHAMQWVVQERLDRGDDRKTYSAILVTAFCLGMLCWNMFTRVVAVAGTVIDGNHMIVSLAYLIAAVLLAGVVWLISGAGRLVRCPDNPQSNSATSESGSADILGESARALISENGLTAREQEATALLLDGLTSAESAQRMGIRPSTVRAYLQRVYNKLGVTNADELSEMIAARSMQNEPFSAVPVQSSASRQGWLRRVAFRAVALGGMLGTFILLLVPYHNHGMEWGLGRELLIGGASAIVVASAAAMFVRWMGSSSADALHVKNRMKRNVRAAFLGTLTLVSGLVLLYYLSCESAGAHQRWFSSSLVWTCSAWLFFVCWAASVAKGLMYARAYAGSLRAPALGGISIAVALCLLASISPETWVACALASLLALACSFFLASETREDATYEQAPDAGLDGVGIGVFFALGFSVEELWRALSSFSLVEATIPCLAALIIAGAVFSPRAAMPVRLASWIVVLSSVGGVVVGGGHTALCIGALAQILVLVAYGVRKKVVRDGTLLLWSLSAGAGCLVGVVAVDMISDALIFGDILLRPFGGRALLSERVSVGAGVLFMTLGVAGALLCKRLHEEVQMRDLSIRWGPRMDERIHYYFLGAGLNETQALVLVEVVHGFSSSAISERLNYARGTVNSARDSAYRALSVHSRAQLIALLKENAGL